MRPSLCRSCLASLLKLLNFLQTFVGISIVLYSAWILNHLRKGKLGDGVGFDLDKLSAPQLVCALMGIGILVCLIVFTGHVAAEAISSCCLCFVSSTIHLALYLCLHFTFVINEHVFVMEMSLVLLFVTFEGN